LVKLRRSTTAISVRKRSVGMFIMDHPRPFAVALLSRGLASLAVVSSPAGSCA
jgi:hypothetical protein